MKLFVRALVVSATGVLALVTAGSALAAFTTPRLSIAKPAGGLTVGFTQAKDDDALFRLTIYVPTGYAASLTAAPGATIGTVAATAQANAISPDAIVPITGSIRVDSPTAPTHNEASDLACRSGAPADAVWVLVLQLPTGPQEVPVYVSAVTAAPESAFAVAKLVLCLPSPYIPQAMGGAALGAKVLSAQMTVPGVFTAPASGEFRWRAIATPWTVGSAVPNTAGTRELQAVEGLPAQLSAAKLGRGRNVTIAGRLRQGGVGVARVAVQLLRGNTVVRSARTTAIGAYSFRLRLRRGTYSYRTRATIPARDLGAAGCTAAVSAAPCLAATASGSRVTSPLVRFRIR